jgi:hypothetical protein
MVMSYDGKQGAFLDLISLNELEDEFYKDVDQILMTFYDLVLASWRSLKRLNEWKEKNRDKVHRRLAYWVDVRFDYWDSHSPPSNLRLRQNFWLKEASAIGSNAHAVSTFLKKTAARAPAPEEGAAGEQQVVTTIHRTSIPPADTDADAAEGIAIAVDEVTNAVKDMMSLIDELAEAEKKEKIPPAPKAPKF